MKGIAGFGHDRAVHTINVEVAAVGLPLVIEVVDTQEHIDRVLPKLEALIENVVVTQERAHVIRYASGKGGHEGPPRSLAVRLVACRRGGFLGKGFFLRRPIPRSS